MKEDFYRLHIQGDFGGHCYCVAWWMPNWETWNERTGEQNKKLREVLFCDGISDGYMLYLDDEPSGWCQVYQRDSLPNLVNSFHFDPDPQVWAVTCFMIAPDARKKGLAHELLKRILVDLKSQGVTKVQAFPKSESGLPASEVWAGPLGVYQKAGFVKIKDFPRRGLWEISL